MKQLFASLLSVLAVTAACTGAVFAEETDSVNVYVTISDAEGTLALAAESIAVSDIDGDGALTINDALYLAHEACYDGGAAAGYASAYGDYGLSLNKLWGTENGGSYGYYVNNASAWSLADPVADGDYINAFVYTDLNAWSDTYCYFDANSVSAEAGEEVTLTLLAAGYDADWNPAVLPVEDAIITIDGEASDWRTDAEGKVTLSFKNGGNFVISAVSDTQILVPPVCKAAVTGTEEETAAPTEALEATEAEPTETTASEEPTEADTQAAASDAKGTVTSPDTGNSSGLCAAGAGALACLGIVTAARKRNHEK